MNTLVITQEFGNDPLREGKPAVIELPIGHYRVWRGAVKPGDLYLNWDVWCASRGTSEYWIAVDDLTSNADGYECLIRRGVSVDETCVRCGCVNAVFYSHTCSFCREIIMAESTRSSR